MEDTRPEEGYLWRDCLGVVGSTATTAKYGMFNIKEIYYTIKIIYLVNIGKKKDGGGSLINNVL